MNWLFGQRSVDSIVKDMEDIRQRLLTHADAQNAERAIQAAKTVAAQAAANMASAESIRAVSIANKIGELLK